MFGLIFMTGKSFLFSLTYPDHLWSPPSLSVSGTSGSFPRLMLMKDEADCLPPSRAEVKTKCSYTSAGCLTCTYINSYTIYLLLSKKYTLQGNILYDVTAH